MQIKATVRYPLGGCYSSKEKKTSVGENLDNLGPLCIASENVKWYSHYGKLFLIPKNRITI